MALALPLISSGEIAFAGVSLPKIASGGIAFAGVSLPKIASGEIAFAGVKLPALISGELIPAAYTITPTGGVTVGGRANIVGDPDVIPQGGVVLGGGAAVQLISILRSDYYPLGGLSVGGTAANAFAWVAFLPSGGVLVEGAAATSSTLIPPLQFTHTPQSGVQLGDPPYATHRSVYSTPLSAPYGVFVGGKATVSDKILVYAVITPTSGLEIGGSAAIATVDIIVHTIAPTRGVEIGGTAAVSDVYVSISAINPADGVLIGGAATVASVVAHAASGTAILVGGSAGIIEYIPFTPAGGIVVAGTSDNTAAFMFAATGGVVLAGSGPLVAVAPFEPSGGTSVGGAAAIRDYQAYYLPTGGVSTGGSAVAYLLPSGTVTTPENPDNDVYAVWAINYETAAPSRYTKFPANSITTFQGVTYVANAAGIYAVDSSTDAGRNIDAYFTTPKHDFNDSRDKKVPTIYLSAVTAGRLKCCVTVNKLSPIYYPFTDSRAKPGAVRNMRATTGKALQGRFWQFHFENINGAATEIDSVELTPETLPRRGA